jgi:hypothetical protein
LFSASVGRAVERGCVTPYSGLPGVAMNSNHQLNVFFLAGSRTTDKNVVRTTDDVDDVVIERQVH